MYYLLVLNLIMPFVMVLVGYTFKKHPASDMDPNNGYNTPTSRKTREHWEYAQSIAPDIFISFGKALGLIEIVLSVAMYLFHSSIHEILCVGVFLGMGFLFWGFYKTCELKVCTTKKPENPSVFLTLPVAHELSVLCMI